MPRAYAGADGDDLRVVSLVLDDLVQQRQQRLPSAIHDSSANLNHVDMRQDSDYRRFAAGDDTLVHQRLTHQAGRNVVAVTAAAVTHDLPRVDPGDKSPFLP